MQDRGKLTQQPQPLRRWASLWGAQSLAASPLPQSGRQGPGEGQGGGAHTGADKEDEQMGEAATEQITGQRNPPFLRILVRRWCTWRTWWGGQAHRIREQGRFMGWNWISCSADIKVTDANARDEQGSSPVCSPSSITHPGAPPPGQVRCPGSGAVLYPPTVCPESAGPARS